MFENLRGDFAAVRDANIQRGWWQRYRWSQNLRVLLQPTFPAVVIYRLAHWVEGLRIPVVRQLLWFIAAILRRLVAVLTGVYIMPKAEIGPGLIIHMAVGGVGVGATKIGANCTLNGGVKIANGAGQIGDNVYFGAGVVVVGDARIGNNVVIMPNSLVLTDAPIIPPSSEFQRESNCAAGARKCLIFTGKGQWGAGAASVCAGQEQRPTAGSSRRAGC